MRRCCATSNCVCWLEDAPLETGSNRSEPECHNQRHTNAAGSENKTRIVMMMMMKWTESDSKKSEREKIEAIMNDQSASKESERKN
jgi:hypothetical protein